MIAQQPGSIRAPVVDTPWNPPRHGMDTNLLKNPANNAFTGMFMNICMNFWYKLMYQICRLKWYIGGFGQQEIHQKEKFHWFISFSFPILTGVIQASPHCWAPTKPASCRLNNGILRALYINTGGLAIPAWHPRTSWDAKLYRETGWFFSHPFEKYPPGD